MAAELVAIAEALFDFEGLRTDNLPFKKGDVITVVEMNESGWWKGCDASGRVGIFPYNYVELRDDVGASFPIVRAKFDFEEQEEGQLGFKRGELLTLLRELSVDWWMGRNKEGHEGVFPANRVEKTEEEDAEAAKAEKKRWSRIRKEKKKELELAAKQRKSLQRKEKKQKDEEERERLAKEAAEADARARRAEEELERVRAEAALLKQQQQAKEAKRSSRARKATSTTREAVRNEARKSAMRWKGMAPGPPPELEAEQARYLEETSSGGGRKKKNKSEDDDLFGPAPPVEEMPGMTAGMFQDPEARSAGSASTSKTASEEEPEQEVVEPPKPPTKFKVKAKFANLGGGRRCVKCEKGVGFADKVTALGGDWHKDCFRCSTCSKVLRQGEWREHNNFPYCNKCHATGFGIKGFGFGGSVVAVDRKDVKGDTIKPSSQVDDRPMFAVLKDYQAAQAKNEA